VRLRLPEITILSPRGCSRSRKSPPPHENGALPAGPFPYFGYFSETVLYPLTVNRSTAPYRPAATDPIPLPKRPSGTLTARKSRNLSGRFGRFGTNSIVQSGIPRLRYYGNVHSRISQQNDPESHVLAQRYTGLRLDIGKCILGVLQDVPPVGRIRYHRNRIGPKRFTGEQFPTYNFAKDLKAKNTRPEYIVQDRVS